MAHTVDTNLIAQKWSKELLKRAKNKSIIMTRYAGYGENNVVQEKDDLLKDQGDRINFGLLPIIQHRTTDGTYVDHTSTIKGDNALETNEDALTFRGDYVTIDQRRRAVVSDGKFFEKKISFKFRRASVEALSRWAGADLDWLTVNALTNTGAIVGGDTPDELSHKNVVFGGDATTVDDIDAADVCKMSDIFKLRIKAEQLRINPIIVNGVEYFLLLLHPECAYDLKMQTPGSVVSWWETQLHAAQKGSNNPIFTGALGIVDGVILATHRDVCVATTWGAGNNIRGAKNLLLGAQAGMWGWAMKPWWVEKTFDYGNKLGVATGYMAGAKASVFDIGGTDYEFGTIGFYTASSGVLGSINW